MKKILTILMVLLWVTSGWSGDFYDSSSTTYLNVPFITLDADAEALLGGWDSVHVVQAYQGVRFRLTTYTTGNDSYDIGNVFPDTLFWTTYPMNIRASNDAGNLGTSAYTYHILTWYGTTYQTPIIGTYTVNDVGLGDLAISTDLDSVNTAIADANKGDFKADVSAVALEASLFDGNLNLSNTTGDLDSSKFTAAYYAAIQDTMALSAATYKADVLDSASHDNIVDLAMADYGVSTVTGEPLDSASTDNVVDLALADYGVNTTTPLDSASVDNIADLAFADYGISTHSANDARDATWSKDTTDTDTIQVLKWMEDNLATGSASFTIAELCSTVIHFGDYTSWAGDDSVHFAKLLADAGDTTGFVYNGEIVIQDTTESGNALDDVNVTSVASNAIEAGDLDDGYYTAVSDSVHDEPQAGHTSNTTMGGRVNDIWGFTDGNGADGIDANLDLISNMVDSLVSLLRTGGFNGNVKICSSLIVSGGLFADSIRVDNPNGDAVVFKATGLGWSGLGSSGLRLRGSGYEAGLFAEGDSSGNTAGANFQGYGVGEGINIFGGNAVSAQALYIHNTGDNDTTINVTNASSIGAIHGNILGFATPTDTTTTSDTLAVKKDSSIYQGAAAGLDSTAVYGASIAALQADSATIDTGKVEWWGNSISASGSSNWTDAQRDSILNMVRADSTISLFRIGGLLACSVRVSNALSTAAIFESTGGNGHGLRLTGHGTGEGLRAQGGSDTGHGFMLIGGGTGSGLYTIGGATGTGILAYGGGSGAAGVWFEGTGGNKDFSFTLDLDDVSGNYDSLDFDALYKSMIALHADSGGAASVDWSTNERQMIRRALGVSGSIDSLQNYGITYDYTSGKLQDTLTVIHGDIEALAAIAGSGANAVEITVKDDKGSYVDGMKVRLVTSGGASSYYRTTETNGTTLPFTLDNGTYYGYVCGSPLYSQDVLPDTFTFTADYKDTIMVTLQNVGEPTDTAKCRVYGYIYDFGGNKLNGAVVSFKIPDDYWPIYHGLTAIKVANITTTSDVDGYWFKDIYPNISLSDTTSRYIITATHGGVEIFNREENVPDSTSWYLPAE